MSKNKGYSAAGGRSSKAANSPNRPPSRPANSNIKRKNNYKNEDPRANYNRPAGARQKKRRGSRVIHIFFLLTLVFSAIVILSVTVLFNLRNIKVEGDSRYTQEQVVKASGIEFGQNLLRINSKKTAKAIELLLPYAENVKVIKKFPFNLSIKVMEPKVQAVVKSADTTYIISGEGKVLETNPATVKGLLAFEGFTVTAAENNTLVMDLDMLSRLCTIKQEIDSQQLAKVTAIRSTSLTESEFTYDNRVIVKLGSLDELAYKIKFAAYLIANKVNQWEVGVLDATEPGKGSFNPGIISSSPVSQSLQSSIAGTNGVTSSTNSSATSISTSSASSVVSH